MLSDIDFELHSKKLGTLQCCLSLGTYILNCFEFSYWNVGPRFYIHVARNLQRLKSFMFLLPELYFFMQIVLPLFHLNFQTCCHMMATKINKPVAIHTQLVQKFTLSRCLRYHTNSLK
jgi:hypothetical protein